MKVTFPYRSSRVLGDTVYEGGRILHRPVVNLRLITAAGAFRQSFALLDSGADDCLFPLRLLPSLGLRKEEMVQGRVSGLNTTSSTTYYEPMSVDLGQGLRFRGLIGFVEDLDSSGVGLLGQNGFFSNFNVEFGLQEEQFSIESPKS